MNETNETPEAKLTAAGIAWQDYVASRAAITRITRYNFRSEQMRKELSLAEARNYTAGTQLSRLLKLPVTTELLSPAMANQNSSPIVPLDSSLPHSGDRTLSPCLQTGD